MSEDKVAPSKFFQSLMALNGVSYVSIEKYSLTLKKGEAHEWKSVLPKVLNLLANQIAPNQGLKELKPSTVITYQTCYNTATY